MPVSPYRSSFTDPTALNYRLSGSSQTNSQYQNYRPKSASVAPAQKLGATTSLSAVTGGSPSSSNQPPMEGTPTFDEPDYDAMIAPALSALEGAIAPAQEAYQADITGAERTRQTRIAGQQESLGAAEREAGTSRTRTSGVAESAVDEARRQFSELQQGLQARYGGTTGTGAFATELAGSQTLKNVGNIRTALTGALTEIDNSLQRVRGTTQIALQDIEDKAIDERNLAKQRLDQTLTQIRSAKGELMSRKAELASQAMQFYQQQVQAVNERNAAFKQNIYLKQLEAEQKLQSARQSASKESQALKDLNLVLNQEDTSLPMSIKNTSAGFTGGGALDFGVDSSNQEDGLGLPSYFEPLY